MQCDERSASPRGKPGDTLGHPVDLPNTTCRALPRLLGLAAEHWLDTPGLEALHIDIDEVGRGHMRLHEVRAVYRGAGGHRFQFVLRDIELRYSLASRTMERLDIASGELDIFPGQEAQHSPWPQIEMPSLPLNEVQEGHLRVAWHWPEKLPLEAVGNFRLREMAGPLQGEFRPGSNLLRVTASQPRHPGRELEIHAEWQPAATTTGKGRRAAQQC